MFREPISGKIKLLALAAIMALFFGFCSYAAEMPDEKKTGSICVTLTAEESGEALIGGSMTIYKAGEAVHDDDWNYSFRLADEFAESHCSLDDLNKRNAEIAKELAGYASMNDLSGMLTLTIDDEGKVYFTDLPIGLYLLIQTEVSEGYYLVNPFIVSVPLYNEDSQTYRYLDIDAFPKTEPAQKEIPAQTEPVPEETKPSDTSGHSGSGGGSSGSHSGGSTAGGPGVSDGSYEESLDIGDISDLSQTGEGRALLYCIMAFMASAIALIVLFVYRKRKERDCSQSVQKIQNKFT